MTPVMTVTHDSSVPVGCVCHN